ncbi:MAG TPA: enoyl-CoA hydratase-related protein, partial [Acidimicrobiales bacterium]|nr:enoyl-CoA hydratase-related protein [Acidimicrobiales bacterium]
MSDRFSSDVLSIDVDGHVATLWLDRPAARNALGPAFWADLPRAMAELSGDDRVRAVVIAARGPHFSVGLDLKAMGALLAGADASPAATPSAEASSDAPSEVSPAAKARATRATVVRLQAAITAVADCPKPVVAAVHGYCIGGGV